MRTSRYVVRSSDPGCLISGFCSSGRGFAPRFLQTPPRGDALALRSHFTSIRLCRGLAPPGCRTCSAHDYHVDVSFAMTGRAGPEDNPLKFDEMFRRRLEKGQYHMAPYLGCREFPATITPARDDDPAPIPEDLDLGRMLLDVDFGRPNRPVFFDAVMRRGVVE